MNTLATIPVEEFERRAKDTAKFGRLSTSDLMARDFPPIRWVVNGYIAEGLSILAGRQKLGKTWLAMDWALAVACGGTAMGSVDCEAGSVLYIDMENGPRRMQARINTLYGQHRNRPNLCRLDWMSDAPQLDKGFLDLVEEWRRDVADPRLVVIDVLQRVKPPGKANQNSYESDYASLAPLQRWATEHHVAVVALHHTRKGGADDPLEALSGSNGLSACADTTLLLDRNQNGVTLYVRGRDVEERETALSFTGGYWSVIGDAAEVKRSTERSIILDFLSDNPEPITPTDLAIAIGKKPNNIKQLLFKMAKAGDVVKEHGRYILTPSNRDNR